MKNTIVTCELPHESEISRQQRGAYFSDAYAFETRYHERTSLEVWLAHMATIPPWINFLMATRNKVVSSLGLKNLGHLGAVDSEKAAADYQVGDAVGIFTIKYVSDNEIILTDSDKHLAVNVSVYKTHKNSEMITISTVVHVHNLWGKIYMFFVAPVHRKIVPATIRRAEFS